MPFASGGTFSLIPSYKATPGQTIRTEQHNPVLEDIANALSAVLKRDGRDGMVGPLSMGSFPITNVAASQIATNAATVGQVQSSAPIGLVADFAGSIAPDGWLLCYGQAVSRTAYAALFAAIGTTYGTGDGTTTFNVPDLRGRAVAGRDNMGGTAAGRLASISGLGSVGGSESVSLTAAQLPANIPNDAATTTATSIGAGSQLYGGQALSPAPASPPNIANVPYNATPITAVSTSTTVVMINPGGGSAHNNVQPTMALNKIIKATY
ncbi:phage tail protein [Mesorhizobium hungaricum]|jgi:microcystin-dependent protein|uniref:phage tail protein n=2 Tax=Pseudomonadota TaxID=1224 RepID=UPI0009F1BE94|nr:MULTISPECIES: tail fiber protein [Mesorhizobium]